MKILKDIFYNKTAIMIAALCMFEYVLATYLISNDYRDTMWNNFYNVGIAIIPMYGGIIGMIRVRQWGGWKSVVGRAMLFLSLGQFSRSLGAWTWVAYYFIVGDPAPYPSIADVFYTAVYPLWGAGVVLLGLMSVVHDGASLRDRILSICMPVFMGIVTYYWIAVDLHGGQFWQAEEPIKVLFDTLYPMGDISILAILVMVCGSQLNYFGNRIRTPFTIIVVFLLMNYVADFIFSYTTTIGTFYSGSIGDVLFATSLTGLSLSLNRLTPSLLEDKE